MKKVLVIGIKGMAGHVIFRYLNKIETLKVFGLARNVEENADVFNIDVSDTEKLGDILEKEKFGVVINCVGILNKDAEDHPAKAIWFNSYFPHFLEEITKNTSTKIFHISTDCVFSGKKGNYSETDIKDGEGFYAQSKALGELENAKDLTVRTSIIGPDLNKKGIGLFNWFMAQNGEINGYSSAVWSGVTTLELAKAIAFLIDNTAKGVVHLTNGTPINKFDLTNLFKETFKKDNITINPYDGKIIDKSFQKSEKINYDVPSYEQMISEMKDWIESENLYSY